MRIFDGNTYRDMTTEEIASIQEEKAAYEAAERTRPLTSEEVTSMLIKQQINSLTVDDATASRMVDFFPALRHDGSLIKVNTRINWCGALKRAAVDLWDTEGNNPDNAPTLWDDIQYRNGVRVIPAAILATDPFKLGDLGWWGDDLYRSTYDGENVWTPEGYPAAWEKIDVDKA